MMTNGLGLIIHHNIYLTREQRYALHEGQDIEVAGVSVSVWCRGKVTSEPAKEVYCRYLLKNPGEDQPVKMVKDGFELCLPNKKPIVSKIPDDIWLKFTPEQRDDYYGVFKNGASTQNLLDIKDGGSACLMYRENNKVRYADDDDTITIIHLIQMRDTQVLEDTCSFTMNWPLDH